MPLYLALITIFLSVFLLIVVLLRLLYQRYTPTARRLRDMEQVTADAAQDLIAQAATKKSKLPPGLEKALVNLGRLGGAESPKNLSKTAAMLVEAGIHHEYGPALFTGIRLSLAFLLVTLYYVFGARLVHPPSLSAMLALILALVGLSLPNMVLRSITAQRRQEIGESLSDALDLLVICMEAGLGLNAALLRVAQELGMRSPVLSRELLLVTQEMRTGLSREVAMRNLCVRNKVENLRILVGALVLADKLGTSLADTLRAQADSLRTRLRQSAEEQAAKAGIKMLIPLVLFIFPALFIVILGPGFISILKNFSGLAGQ
ncbi:type II secretion system F family protein [bacterium]|nr:type II secretion system F family protein [bacterium]